ncbi:DNA repair-scaffolding protein isoform X1 [Ornithorhynchus anatinus]|nr:DNA repair-scaffolding protein isoform X1 [Ornithorhynchus anatinus]
MPRGSSGGRKRKRTWDSECKPFPGQMPAALRREDPTATVAAASLSKEWRRCGEGFQSTASPQSLGQSEKKSNVEKYPELSLTHEEEVSSTENANEPADIVWSSSGSDLSDEENTTFPLGQKLNPSIDKSYTESDVYSEGRSSEGEPQVIDWENDSVCEEASDEYHDSGKDESAVEICDSDSSTNSHPLVRRERMVELPQEVSTEILEYPSDSENPEKDSENVVSINPGFACKLPLNMGADVGQLLGRSASDWVKSAQELLHTPKKRADVVSKTPENSAQKRKLLRGGLAERLNRLQNRERSAINLWRYQCESSNRTLSGGKSGVLIVRILELYEECTLQVAICEQLETLPDTDSSEDAVLDSGARLRVLFTKETAAHLKGGPQDIIHIYPPWQKLLLRDQSLPVIMNTYFSQKMVFKGGTEMAAKERSPKRVLIRRNIMSLTQTFRLKILSDNPTLKSSEHQVPDPNVAACKMGWDQGHPEPKCHDSATQPLVSDSLLDVIESQGVARWRGVQVRVVVQRVYFLPAKGGSRCQYRNNSVPSATPIASSDLPSARLCLLVQDAYGMFSEVQLQTTSSSTEDTIQHSWKLEGKSCTLTGMKIFQRITRGRALGLFSLISSLWPPVMPLKILGQSQDCEEMKTNLPPPSFCYVLTAPPDQGQVEVNEDDHISSLYLPPALRSLKDILETGSLGHRCSFQARVIYQRLQLNSSLPPEQREIWLVVMDATLQTDDENSSSLPKTVPVCVIPSCVLSAEVTEAFRDMVPCDLFFKDALQERGRIVCVERTVLSLEKPLLCTASSADSSELTGPVKLDELDSTTQVNSICSLRGTVVGVDESTAFSWPVCNRCGNGQLGRSSGDGLLYCDKCSQVVTSPMRRMQLEVFLNCPSRPQCTVKVKLLQRSISSLLKFPSSEDGSYEVKSVLGKEVGLLNCYVQSDTNHPTSCIGLEEIGLLQERRN